MTIDDFVERYHCHDSYGESCDGCCENCKEEIRKDLKELFESNCMVEDVTLKGLNTLRNMFGIGKRTVTEALIVSNNILQRAFNENIDITPMKMQKILYFVYRDYLKETGTTLFDERFQTWKFGPVLESVYYAFKKYSKKSITKFYSREGKIYFVDESTSPIFKEILDNVWDKTKKYSGIELSKMTHRQGSAWYKAFAEDRTFLYDKDIKEESVVIG